MSDLTYTITRGTIITTRYVCILFSSSSSTDLRPVPMKFWESLERRPNGSAVASTPYGLTETKKETHLLPATNTSYL